MEGRKGQAPRPLRTKGKSPAERAEEFTATQRRLKDEAKARRDEGDKTDRRRKR